MLKWTDVYLVKLEKILAEKLPRGFGKIGKLEKYREIEKFRKKSEENLKQFDGI